MRNAVTLQLQMRAFRRRVLGCSHAEKAAFWGRASGRATPRNPSLGPGFGSGRQANRPPLCPLGGPRAPARLLARAVEPDRAQERLAIGRGAWVPNPSRR